MVILSKNQKKDMKISETKIGKTTYIVSSNAHLMDKKTVAEKIKRVILNDVSQKS